RGVAGAGRVALVGGSAHDGVGAYAGAGLAGVGPRAGVAVVARRSVELGGIAAGARRGIAGAGGVALVGGRAHDGVGAHASAGLAGVALRARVGVVAARAVGLEGLLQTPDAGPQVPAVWHWLAAVHTTGLAPTQAPAWQVSLCVHALASLQLVP